MNIKIPKTVFLFFCVVFSYAQQQKNDSIALNQVDQYLKNNNSAKALYLALEHLEEATKHNDTLLLIKWNDEIGKIFRYNNFDKSARYYNEAKKIAEKYNDSLQLANVYFDIGSLYMLNYSDKTYKAQDINVALDKKDTALVYFKKVLKNFKNINGVEKIIAKAYANLTGLYSYTGDQRAVVKLAKKAISYFERKQDTLSIIGVKSNLGINQLYQGQYDKATKNYLEALEYLKDTSNLKILDLRSINLDNLSNVYSAQKKYKLSRDYLQKAQKLRIIYLEKMQKKELTEIESKYNLDVAIAKEKEKTIQEVAKKDKAESRLLILMLLGILGLFIILLLYRNYRVKTIKKELFHQQNIQELQQNIQNKILDAGFDGSLKERQKISQILHDSVSALLSSANLHLQVVKRKCGKGFEEITKTQQILDEASVKVRDLSHQLVSVVLLKFGLQYALEDLCEKLSNDHLKFEFKDAAQQIKFNQNLEMKVFNIIEECVNNILKHSQATQALIKIEFINEHVVITIQDNGIGININQIVEKEGIGVYQVESRIKALNGTFKIVSKPQNGTQIILGLPIQSV